MVAENNNETSDENSNQKDDNMAPPEPAQWGYIVLDHVMCLFVLAPLVPTYWRGTWFLIGYYFYPDNLVTHGWILLAIGCLGPVPFYLLQNSLLRLFGDPHPLSWLLVYHVFIYVFTLLSVAHWKGVWALLDHYTGFTVTSAISCVAIATGLLTLLRCFKTVGQTAPLMVDHDTTRNVLVTPTRFNRHREGSSYHFVLDTLLTICLINSLVVLFWRGAWTAMDLLLYPDDFDKTAEVSTAVGAVLAVVLYVAQFKVAKLFGRRKSDSATLQLFRQLCLDVVLLIGGFCTVFFWRGIWYLWDIYLWPEDPVRSNWFTHGLGFGVLGLLGVSSSLCVRSSIPDEVIPGNPDKLYPLEFIMYWIQPNDQVIFNRKSRYSARIDINAPQLNS